MVYSTSLTTKPCTEKSCMHTMTTLQLHTLDELPPMSLSAETIGGQEYEKELLDTSQIVTPVQESNLYVVEAPTTAAHLFWVVHKSHGGKLLIA